LNEEAFMLYFSDNTIVTVTGQDLAHHFPDRVGLAMSDEDAIQYELLRDTTKFE
jgi:hypothetical protein